MDYCAAWVWRRRRCSRRVAPPRSYTQESPLYRRLNALLRQRDRAELGPFFPFVKLLLSAVYGGAAPHCGAAAALRSLWAP